ncbi:GvpH protein [Halogranum amylolyticum]|uniref:GvpH protein n=1 Tax=Halogranum amylolyticum TaxID=660520 RepID=A0A1H8T8U1_9EURY|nr:gas vesicle protein GvpH [Halogranum amylolyticum]SEO87156.1 GvpH protein [Halogranum amylolyticum]
MTYDENGPDEDREDDGRPRGIRLGLGLQPLVDLLDALMELDVSRPPASERVALETDAPGGEREETRRVEGNDPTTRDDGSLSEECRIDTRRDDRVFTVVADLPGATIDDVSVGIDPRANELVVQREGTVVGRIVIPWESPVVSRVWFNNGILEVRLEPQ